MLKVVLAFLFTLKIIFSICPNDCSGNGKCTKEGVCICHKQSLTSATSTIYGYTGADCSERVCPLGNSFVKVANPNSVILQTASTQTSGTGGSRQLDNLETISSNTIENQTEISSVMENKEESQVEESGRNATRKLQTTIPSITIGSITAYSISSTKFNGNVFTSLSCNGVKCSTSCDYTDPTTGGNAQVGVTIWGYKSNLVILEFNPAPSTVDSAYIQSITSCGTVTVEINDFSNFQPIVIGSTPADPVTLTLPNYANIFTAMGYTPSSTVDLWCYHTDLTKVDGKLFIHSSTLAFSSSGDNEIIDVSPSNGLLENDKCYVMAKPDSSGVLASITPTTTSDCSICNQFKIENNNIWYKTGMTCAVTESAGASPSPPTYTMTIKPELSELLANDINTNKKATFNLPNHCTGESVKMLKNLHKGTELTISYGGTAVVDSTSAVLIKASESTDTPAVYTAEYENNIPSITKIADTSMTLTLKALEEITPLININEILYKVKRNFLIGRMGGIIEGTCKDGNNNEVGGVTKMHVWGFDGKDYSYVSFDKDLQSDLCLKPYTTGSENECTPNSVYPSDIECTGTSTPINDYTDYKGIIVVGNTPANAAGPVTIEWKNYGKVFTDMGLLPTANDIKVWCYHTDLLYVDSKLHKNDLVLSVAAGSDDLTFSITASSGVEIVKGDVCYLMAKADSSGGLASITPTSPDKTASGCDVCDQFKIDSNIWYKTGMTCNVASTGTPPTYTMSIEGELSKMLAGNISDKLTFNITNHCFGADKDKMLKNLHNNTKLAITYGGLSLTSEIINATESLGVYKIIYKENIPSINDINENKKLEFTLTPLEKITPLKSGDEILYKVKYNYYLGNMGGIICCEADENDFKVNQINVRGYDSTTGYSYISFNENLENELCLGPYTGAASATGECTTNSIYPSDVKCTRSRDSFNDFSNYKNITVGSTTADPIIWKDFGTVFTDMKFNLPPTGDVFVWCYHNKNNIDGIIYAHKVDLTISGIDLSIAITEATGEDLLIEGDICSLMAKLGTSNNEIVAITPTTADNDDTTGCELCNQLIIDEHRKIWLKKPEDLTCKVVKIGSGSVEDPYRYNFTFGATLTRFMINHYIDTKEMKIPNSCGGAGAAEGYSKIRKSANMTIEINGYKEGDFKDKDPHMIYIKKMENDDKNYTLKFRNEIDFTPIKFRKLFDTEGDTKLIMSIILDPAPKIDIIESNYKLKIFKVPYNYTFQKDDFSVIGGNFTANYYTEDGSQPTASAKTVKGTFWGFNKTKSYTYLSFDDDTIICEDAYSCGSDKYYPLDFDYTLDTGSEKTDLSNYRWNRVEVNTTHTNHGNHSIILKGYSEIFNSAITNFKPTQTYDNIPIACYHPFKNIDSLLYLYDSTIVADGDDIVISITMNEGELYDNLAKDDLCFILAKIDLAAINIKTNTPADSTDETIKQMDKTACNQCENFYYNEKRDQWYYSDPKENMKCEIGQTGSSSSTATIHEKEYSVEIGSSLTRLIINNYLLKNGKGTYGNNTEEVGKLEIPQHCTDKGNSPSTTHYTDLKEMIRKSANISITFEGYKSSLFNDKTGHIIWSKKDDQTGIYLTFINEFLLENVSYDKMTESSNDNGDRLTMIINVKPAPVITYIQYNDYRIYRIPLVYDYSNNGFIRSNLTVDSVKSDSPLDCHFQNEKAYFWGYDSIERITYLSYQSYKDEDTEIKDDKVCLDPYNCVDPNVYPLDFNYTVIEGSERVDFSDYKYITIDKINNDDNNNKHKITLDGYGTIFKSIGFFGTTTEKSNIPIAFYHPEKNKESLLYIYMSTISRTKEQPANVYEDLVITITPDAYPENNHTAVGDIAFIMAKKDGSAIDLDDVKPTGGIDNELVNSTTSICDQCVNFYYNNFRKQWFYGNPTNFSVEDPGMYCTVKAIGVGITDGSKYIYNITMDATFSRLIINHYLDYKELEIPYSNCSYLNNSNIEYANASISDMLNMVRKSATIRIEISGFGSEEFEDVKTHMIKDVQNDIHYKQNIIIVTLREELLFEKIRFRLLEDIMSDPNKLKMSIIVTPAPKLIPIYSNNGLKVYRVPLNYTINNIENKYIIKANLTCTSKTTNRSNNQNEIVSKTIDGIYWGYKYDIDIHNVISYISYSETLCDDPYGENNDKIENCMNKYAYDFDCVIKDKYTRVDLTDYKEIKLSNLNVTNKSFSWVGFSEILLANGWNISNNDNIFEFKCYHGDKTDDYYSNLTHYEAIVSISSPNTSYPNEINFTPEDVNITINDTLNPNTLQEGDICFLLSTREGNVIELNTSNPVKPIKPDNLDDCDACNVFYYDTIRKEYYIKEIYLHRIQSNYTEFPAGIYTNNTIIFSYGIIGNVIDSYFNYSYYNLLKPTNKSSIPELRKVIQPKNIMELSLSRPDPSDLSKRKVYYKEITQILTVEEKDDMFNISSYPPFLPLKKMFIEVNNTQEINSNYSNREAIIITHVILPNSDCNYETKICKHYLLNFNLGKEGGNLIISKNGEIIGSGNVLSYKSTYPQVCYIQYKFNDEDKYGGENFYKTFNYTLYDYKISSNRNDLSTYTESKVVETKDDDNNTIKTIEWKDYGKSIELMGLVDKEISMICYNPNEISTNGRRRSLGEIEAKEYKAKVTLYKEDIRFLFNSGSEPNVDDICYLTINGNGEKMKIKDIEASTFFIEKEDGNIYYTYIDPDEVIFTTVTTTTTTNEGNKTLKSDVIKAGKSIFEEMQEIYNEEDEDEEEIVNPTESPIIPSNDPSESPSPTEEPKPTPPPVKQPNFAVPLPKDEQKNVVISKVESNKWIKVQIYLGSIKVLESTVKITRIVRTTDNFVIVKITPSINLNIEDMRMRRMSSNRRRRVLQNKDPIIIITLDIESPSVGETDQIEIPYSGTLNLNKEGGLLYCTNLNNGEKGILDVTSYYRYNEKNMMYVKFGFSVSTELTTLSCQIAFKRNDLSLYTDSVVESYQKEYDQEGGTKITKYHFRVVWKGYSLAFQELIKPEILPRNDLQEFKMLCFHPDGSKDDDGSIEGSSYKLHEFVTHIASISSDLWIEFYDGQDELIEAIDGINSKQNNDGTLRVGDICYPMNYIETADGKNGDTKSIGIKEIGELDAAKYFEYKKESDDSDGGEWYYNVVSDSEGSKSSITTGGPQIMYNKEISESVLKTYSESKEIPIIISDDETGGVFKMKISNGMIIEIYVKGTEDGKGYEKTFIGQIGSIRSGKDENELIITTIEDFPDFPKFKQSSSSQPRRRRVLADSSKEIENVAVAITLRENLMEDKLMECSGNGICDRKTGKCNCFDGFTGISCQRLDCPNNCNKRGRCVPLIDLLSENELKDYGGFGNEDKVYGCLCDKGYRGFDCSLIECPSGEDYLEGSNMDDEDEQRDCSGRGICDYKTGICECFSGFMGEGCQYYQILG